MSGDGVAGLRLLDIVVRAGETLIGPVNVDVPAGDVVTLVVPAPAAAGVLARAVVGLVPSSAAAS